jgi:cell division protein FtsN
MYRVRLGPYQVKDEADTAQNRLQGSGVDAALVRVQR